MALIPTYREREKTMYKLRSDDEKTDNLPAARTRKRLSKITWTERTWSPLIGCTKDSTGCKYCYAEREVTQRWSKNPKSIWYGRNFADVLCRPEALDEPLRWRKAQRIFVCPRADLFHDDVSDEFLDQVFGVMWACLYQRDETAGHVFQLLTKRADRMCDYLLQDRREQWARAAVDVGGGINPDGLYDQTLYWEGPHPRIWLGVSAENQAAADRRVTRLLQTPASIRWVSVEPLIGPVDLTNIDPPDLGDGREYSGIDALSVANRPIRGVLDWVVSGGESGPRPMHPDWARSLRDQCAEAHVPFLHKQHGEYIQVYDRDRDDPDLKRCAEIERKFPQGRWLNLAGGYGFSGERVIYVDRVGMRKNASRLLDGVLHDEYPATLGEAV